MSLTALALQGCSARTSMSNGQNGGTNTNAVVNGTVSAEGITVTSPSNGSSVGISFTLSATAPTCSSQAVASMGYSLDNSSSTTTVSGTSISSAKITAAVGSHTLHVKSWGKSGSACTAPVTITVVAAAPTPAPSSGFTVSSPANGASVGSPFSVKASASTCSSAAVVSMGYSLDSSSTTTTATGTSISGSVSASSGAHVLHVKSWNGSGGGCSTDINVTVGGGTTAPTPTPPPSGGDIYSQGIPSGVAASTDIDYDTGFGWTFRHDPGTTGSSSGTSSIVSNFAGKAKAREYTMTYKSGGGEIFYSSYANDTLVTHFVYDNYVYIASGSNIANLEMDMNQVMSDGRTVIYGFQCDSGAKTWDYTYMNSSGSHWTHSKQACNVSTWSKNTWHHIQVAYFRDNNGNVTYQYVILDGVKQTINVTVASAENLNWGKGTLLTNFQLDGSGASGGITAYTSGMTIYRW